MIDAGAFVDLFRSAGSEALIGNLTTRVDLAEAAMPFTINALRDGPTCYLCCPSVAYIDYARAELRHFNDWRLVLPLADLLLRACHPLIRLAGLDTQVQLNNWLLATNPPPPLDGVDLDRLTAAMAARFPKAVIVWRSVNDGSDAAVLARLSAAGYRLLPARRIYLLECREAPPPVGRDERRDRALLASGGYRVETGEGWSEADFARAETLYGLLYLDKYTTLNPHYRARLMHEMQRRGLMRFFGLRAPGGQLDGVIALFQSGRVISAPIVGYETALPQSVGLYRMLIALALAEARNGRLLFNMSAGAASFKRNRGAVAATEYTAVYDRHLGSATRRAGDVVEWMLRGIGLPLLTRFEL